MAQQPPVDQRLLIIEASRSHSDTPQSIGLLWTSDQPVPETSTWQNTTLTWDKHSCPPTEFEPTIPVSERPHTHAFDRVATEIGTSILSYLYYWRIKWDKTNTELSKLQCKWSYDYRGQCLSLAKKVGYFSVNIWSTLTVLVVFQKFLVLYNFIYLPAKFQSNNSYVTAIKEVTKFLILSILFA